MQTRKLISIRRSAYIPAWKGEYIPWDLILLPIHDGGKPGLKKEIKLKEVRISEMEPVYIYNSVNGESMRLLMIKERLFKR